MRLVLTVTTSAGQNTDIAVTADAAVTVGELAARLDGTGAAPREITLRVRHPGTDGPTVLDQLAPLARSGLRSGAWVQPVLVSELDDDEPRDYAIVAECVDARARSWPLVDGVNTLGSAEGSRILLPRSSSGAQAEIRIQGASAILRDVGQDQGVRLAGRVVRHGVLHNGSRIELGDEVLVFRWAPGRAGPARPGGARGAPGAYLRPARVQQRFAPRAVAVPRPPPRPPAARIPVLGALSPAIAGIAAYAVSWSPIALVLVATAPLSLLASWVEARLGSRTEHRRALRVYRDALARILRGVERAQVEERRVRESEQPDLTALADAAISRSDLLWSCRPERPDFLNLRVGCGSDRSRVELQMPDARGGDAGEELERVCERMRLVAPVPLLLSLQRHGSVGVVGEHHAAAATARALVLRLAMTHAPSEVGIACLAAANAVPEWNWLKWLPHVALGPGAAAGPMLASGDDASNRLLAVIDERLSSTGADPAALVVLVVGDPGAALDRLVSITGTGPAAGVHCLWVQPGPEAVPASCAGLLRIHPSGAAELLDASAGTRHPIDLLDVISPGRADDLARTIAGIEEVGGVETSGGLPDSISLGSIGADGTGGGPAAVLAAWRAAGGRRSLRASVGVGKAGPLVLDLAEHGPHALVGGTTGSGKSEFLQTWIVAMAAARPPEQVTFLLVDYKGGSSFADCVRLPHTVGLVTDLTPALVERALVSLRAELAFRERLFDEKGVKDLAALDARGEDAPPSLVIVVDEFAALIRDVPEFVDGVIDVAARGRSLGVHLILATQRPGGIVSDAIRANANLRIALRVSDPAESVDVVDVPDAARIDPSAAGRGVVRFGPARAVPFQAAYLGADDVGTGLVVAELPFATGTAMPQAAPPRRRRAGAGHGLPEDIELAAELAGMGHPRRPWLDPLPPVVDLWRLTAMEAGGDGPIPIGLVDRPSRQWQGAFCFDPAKDGHLLVTGPAGAGKSATLRSLAAGAIADAAGGRAVSIYGIADGQGLLPLDHLGPCGGILPVDDLDGVPRLLGHLAEIATSRSAQLARAGEEDFRRLSAPAGGPSRIFLLLDGLERFREQWEFRAGVIVDDFVDTLVALGPAAGVHLGVSAGSERAVPARFAGRFRVALRLGPAEEDAGRRRGESSEPVQAGRGRCRGDEIQIAIPEADPSAAGILRAFEALGARSEGVRAAAPVPRLPVELRLSELATFDAEGNPVVGIRSDRLSAIGIDLHGLIVIQGRAGTGTTTALRTCAAAALRADPARRLVWCTPEGRGAAPDRTGQEVGQDAVAAALAPDRGAADPPDRVIVIESVAEFAQTRAEEAIECALRAAEKGGCTLIVEVDPARISEAWRIAAALRGARTAVILAPEEGDGSLVLRLELPRSSRPPAGWRPGLGVLVSSGTARPILLAREGNGLGSRSPAGAGSAVGPSSRRRLGVATRPGCTKTAVRGRLDGF